MIVIKDDHGRNFKISNLEKFKNHLKKYHSNNGRGDNSLHEEDGFWFHVTEDFYYKIMSMED